MSDLRPDLVAYDVQTKSILLLELTVCFETNYEDARKRKEDKYSYSELVEEVEKNGFDVESRLAPAAWSTMTAFIASETQWEPQTKSLSAHCSTSRELLSEAHSILSG